MESLKYCKLCLVTDVKMFSMNTPSILEAYTHLVQIVCGDYQMYICYECVSLLHKYQEFRNKCLTALNVLSSIHMDHSKITKDLVENVDRKLYNLVSKLANYSTKQCNSTDDYTLPEDCFITHEKLFINDLKSETDIQQHNTKIEFETEMTTNVDSPVDHTSVFQMTLQSLDSALDDDYIPELKKKRKPAPNLKKRKLKTNESNMEIKQEQSDSSDFYDEPLAKRAIKSKRKGNCRNDNTLKKRVRAAKKQKSPQFDATSFNDYATVVLMTPEDAEKEMLLRKESSNYKISPHKCDLCYRGYEVKAAFENHMKKHSPEYGSWECDHCHLRFTARKSWKHHNVSCHQYKFICKICPYVCYYNYQAKTHMNFHKGKKYTCEECGETFSMPKSLSAHKLKKHQAQAENVCAWCGSIFASQQAFDAHKMLSHRVDSNELLGPKCAECDVQFATETAWKRHLVLSSKHTVSNGCEYCGETFSNKNDLKVHAKQHSHKWVKIKTGAKLPAACKLCDKWLPTLSEYKSHMKSQHPDSEAAKKIEAAEQRKFVCEECGMAFKNRCFLQYHQRKHTGERPYECRECGKRFRVQGVLYQHENTHTRRRVYQCDVCQKEFNTKFGLVKHVRANHLGIRPHRCSFCDKSFPNPSDLKVHIKYVHYKVPWPKRDRTKRTAKEESAVL